MNRAALASPAAAYSSRVIGVRVSPRISRRPSLVRAWPTHTPTAHYSPARACLSQHHATASGVPSIALTAALRSALSGSRASSMRRRSSSAAAGRRGSRRLGLEQSRAGVHPASAELSPSHAVIQSQRRDAIARARGRASREAGESRSGDGPLDVPARSRGAVCELRLLRPRCRRRGTAATRGRGAKEAIVVPHISTLTRREL